MSTTVIRGGSAVTVRVDSSEATQAAEDAEAAVGLVAAAISASQSATAGAVAAASDSVAKTALAVQATSAASAAASDAVAKTALTVTATGAANTATADTVAKTALAVTATGNANTAAMDAQNATAAANNAAAQIVPDAGPSLLIKPGTGTFPSVADTYFTGRKSLYSNFDGIRRQLRGFTDVTDFARASAATYFDAAGVLQTAASGVARLGSRLSGATWVLAGLLVEGQATNLLLQSATLATQSITVSATAYTLSFYGPGSVTLSGASTAGPLVGSATGRSMLTFTPTAGTLTLTVSGSVTSAQIELGTSATSYIPTTTAQATRAADMFSKALGVEFNPAAQTALFKLRFERNPVDTQTKAIWIWDDGTSNNRITVFVIGDGRITLQNRIANVDTTIQGAVTALGVDYKIAIGFGGGTLRLVINGVAYTDASATPPTGLTTRRIGMTTAAQPNAFILPYLPHPTNPLLDATEFPRLLSVAEMQGYTA